MATTIVDICARALIMVGASPISSFSDGSTEALVASNIYEDIVEASLCRSRWRFATTQKQISHSPPRVGVFAQKIFPQPGLQHITVLLIVP